MKCVQNELLIKYYRVSGSLLRAQEQTISVIVREYRENIFEQKQAKKDKSFRVRNVVGVCNGEPSRYAKMTVNVPSLATVPSAPAATPLDAFHHHATP